MNGHTGTGCYIIQHQYKPKKIIIPLGKVTTVYQAKMLGTYAVTMELVTRKVKNKKVIIFKDNQALIHALKAIRSRSKLVIDCVNTFNVIGKNNHILLVWVPNHARIESNGEVYSLTKWAVGVPFYDPEPALPVSDEIMKRIITKRMQVMHERRWSLATQYRQTKETTKKPLQDPEIRIKLNFTRKELCLVTDVKTGHCYLNRHLYILKVIESPRYPKFKLADETPAQHIGRCPTYVSKRMKHFDKTLVNEEEIWKMQIRKVVTYLKDTGRLEERVVPPRAN